MGCPEHRLRGSWGPKANLHFAPQTRGALELRLAGTVGRKDTFVKSVHPEGSFSFTPRRGSGATCGPREAA